MKLTWEQFGWLSLFVSAGLNAAANWRQTAGKRLPVHQQVCCFPPTVPSKHHHHSPKLIRCQLVSVKPWHQAEHSNMILVQILTSCTQQCVFVWPSNTLTFLINDAVRTQTMRTQTLQPNHDHIHTFEGGAFRDLWRAIVLFSFKVFRSFSVVKVFSSFSTSSKNPNSKYECFFYRWMSVTILTRRSLWGHLPFLFYVEIVATQLDCGSADRSPEWVFGLRTGLDWTVETFSPLASLFLRSIDALGL